MRIAVLRPQVPFARGGAEIFTDRLVDELRARGHEADLVTVPFKWYPGARVLTQAFLWRLLDLDEADGKRDRPRRRDEVPVVPRAPPEQARLARAPVPAGVRARRHRARPVRRVAGGPCAPPEGPGARPRRARRGDARSSRRRGTSPTGSSARPGSSAEVLPHRRRSSPTAATATATSCSPSTASTARSGSTCCSRRRRSTPSLEVVIAGDGPDRGRLEGLARDRGLDGRARFAGRVAEAELADLYGRCLAVYYAPVDEDFGMVPFEAFLSEKPVLTTTDAGGPLEVVADGQTGLVVAPGGRRASRSAASWLRDHRDGGGDRSAAPARRSPPRSPGSARSRGCSHEGRLLLARCRPSGSGIADYSALLVPALRRAARRRPSCSRGRKRAPRGTDLALYHVGNNPDAHGWIVDALRRAARASSSCTTSCSTTSSPA